MSICLQQLNLLVSLADCHPGFETICMIANRGFVSILVGPPSLVVSLREVSFDPSYLLFILMTYLMLFLVDFGVFVNDTKIFRSISSDLDSEILQDDFDHLVVWSETWQAFFNIIKCKAMHVYDDW